LNPEPPPFPRDRASFLNLAGGFEAALVLAGLGLSWLTGLDVWEMTSFTGAALLQGLAATLPLLILFGITYRWPAGPLRPIKTFLLEALGAPLAACRWYDLLLVAAMAGLGEELLFRGVMQTGIDRWAGRGVGLASAALAFGLVHFVTPMYALLAGLIGLYLGGLLYLGESPNLLVPIIVHGLYDFVAFWVVRKDYQKSALGES
jgi:membrane protease YdiL (CAAX protease family)